MDWKGGTENWGIGHWAWERRGKGEGLKGWFFHPLPFSPLAAPLLALLLLLCSFVFLFIFAYLGLQIMSIYI